MIIPKLPKVEFRLAVTYTTRKLQTALNLRLIKFMIFSVLTLRKIYTIRGAIKKLKTTIMIIPTTTMIIPKLAKVEFRLAVTYTTRKLQTALNLRLIKFMIFSVLTLRKIYTIRGAIKKLKTTIIFLKCRKEWHFFLLCHNGLTAQICTQSIKTFYWGKAKKCKHHK